MGTKGRRGWMALLVCALLVCALLPWGALAQGLEPGQPLTGEWVYPQGADPQGAEYALSYAYPQFAALTEADQAINAYYQELYREVEDALPPEDIQELLALREPGAPPLSVQVDYRITSTTERYLSVVLSRRQFLGYAESESIQAGVFARDGVYAGQRLSLSQVMGLEEQEEAQDGASYASRLVYQLVWEIMGQQSASLQKDFIQDLTLEQFQAHFHPETDFYLDEDENLVFFIQAGTVAGEVEGILTYPFALVELLSAAGN